MNKKFRICLIPVLTLCFLSVGVLPAYAADFPINNPVSGSNMPLVVYLSIISILVLTAFIAYRWWRPLGAVAGIIGAIFTYYCLIAPNLIIDTHYVESAAAWVEYVVPMGFFAYVPLVLALFNFLVLAKK